MMSNYEPEHIRKGTSIDFGAVLDSCRLREQERARNLAVEFMSDYRVPAHDPASQQLLRRPVWNFLRLKTLVYGTAVFALVSTIALFSPYVKDNFKSDSSVGQLPGIQSSSLPNGFDSSSTAPSLHSLIAAADVGSTVFVGSSRLSSPIRIEKPIRLALRPASQD